jgi:hypothetical protein
MASWEEDLAVLLQNLGVKQEEPQVHLQQIPRPLRRQRKRREPCADACFLDEDNEPDDEDFGAQDIATMRREVDSIVGQVIVLMQRGSLEPSVKEDVMIVLRALRRHLPPAHSSALPHTGSAQGTTPESAQGTTPGSAQGTTPTSEEAYLESASALLHFCRLALQLSEFATED